MNRNCSKFLAARHGRARRGVARRTLLNLIEDQSKRFDHREVSANLLRDQIAESEAAIVTLRAQLAELEAEE